MDKVKKIDLDLAVEQLRQAMTTHQEQSTDEVLQNFLNAMDSVSEIETGQEGYKDSGEWDFIKL